VRAAAVAALVSGATLVVTAPAPALAQAPTATPTPPVATPTPAPPPPATPALATRATGVLRSGKQLVALTGRLTVQGTIAPYVAGEGIALEIRRNGKRTRTVVVPGVDAGNGTGTFTARIEVKRAGRVSVRASHPLTPVLGAGAAAPLVVHVVRPQASMGTRGPLVSLLRRNLSRMKYDVGPGGVYDAATSRAVMAYRKVNGLGRAFSADARTVRKVLAGKGVYRVRHPNLGRHVEADLGRQVLALVDGGRLVRVLHTSSGKPSTPTVIGTFHVYMKTPGTNDKGMVDSSYFIRGYAIHGYVDVPAFNASHGCLRIPIPDARYVYDWLHIGDTVIVEP
jgi:lipoprotein-anchoring transpeptidase ErfK/SrfK